MNKSSVVEIIKSTTLVVMFFVLLWILQGRVESSTKQYILAFGILVVLFLFDVFVFKMPANSKKCNFVYLKKKVTSVIFFIFSMVLFLYIDLDSQGMLGRKTRVISTKVYFVALILMIGIMVAYKYLKQYSRKTEIFVNIIFSVTVVALISLYFRPYDMHDVYNFEAYWLNVSSIYEGIPFSITNVSFYGHYAILLVPFFKIFGLNIYTVQVTQMVGVAIVLLFLFYGIETLTHKTSSRFITKLLVCSYFLFVEAISSVYPQGIPHRLVFVSIILSLVIKFIFLRKNTRTLKIVIDVLCCLSIIWNLETGVVMTLVWAITKSVVESRNKKIFYMILYGCRYVVGAVITFVFAWFSVSVINNFIYGGEFLSLELFIYPLGTDYVSGIGSAVSFSDFIWIFVLGIFVFSFIFSLRRVLISKSDKYMEVVLALSSSSIMLFPYFYNRAAFFNLMTVSYMQLVLLGLIFCIKLKEKRSVLSTPIHIVGLYIALLLVISNISNLTNQSSKGYNVPDKMNYKAFVRELEEVVPENVVFYGTGSSYYAMSIKKSDAFPCNSVNFTSEGMQATKEYFDKAEQDIAIIGNDDYVKGFMEFWGGISLESLQRNYHVEDVTLSQDAGGVQLKILRKK